MVLSHQKWTTWARRNQPHIVFAADEAITLRDIFRRTHLAQSVQYGPLQSQSLPNHFAMVEYSRVWRISAPFSSQDRTDEASSQWGLLNVNVITPSPQTVSQYNDSNPLPISYCSPQVTSRQLQSGGRCTRSCSTGRTRLLLNTSPPQPGRRSRRGVPTVGPSPQHSLVSV